MKTLHNAFLICTSIIILNSCKKGDDGSVGPAGPTGPAGVAGEQGPVGAANVIYSTWMSAVNFRDTLMDNSKLHLASVYAPKLTNSILTTGDVKIYFNFGGGTYVLPYTSYAGSKGSTMSFFPKLGEILISRFTFDNSNSVGLGSSIQYRYVLIPGGTAARTSSLVNWDDYASVAKYLGWKD